jgi:uracil-DNA glycosylase family 4
VSAGRSRPGTGASERDETLADLLAHGRFLSGLTSIGVPAPSAAVLKADPAAAGVRPAVARFSALAGGTGDSRTDDPAAALAAIREEIGDCRRCKLAAGRKTIVFGQGNPSAELMFVGEAPGSEEDEQGLAFVGRAGQLLTDIIEKGMKMKRSDVFIANVLKCRPPQNRNPEPDEILSCQPFLEAQIRAIRPRVLVGLGKFAAQWLLRTAEPISRIRGRLGERDGIPVMPTYHPAYLLRNPAGKKDVWEDMKAVLRLLGRPVPGGD